VGDQGQSIQTKKDGSLLPSDSVKGALAGDSTWTVLRDALPNVEKGNEKSTQEIDRGGEELRSNKSSL